MNIKHLFTTLIASHVAIGLHVEAQEHNRDLWKDLEIVDFSYAGYARGEKAPEQVNHRVFDVTHFGAIANDHQSDRVAIELAIAAAEAHGSGIIFFPKGRYHLHQAGEPCVPIVVKGSHIVFRGEGSPVGGTELYMEAPNSPFNIDEMWTSPMLVAFDGRGFAPTISKVTKHTSKGDFMVEVASADSLKPGQWVTLRLLDNSPECIRQEMHPYQEEANWKSIFLNGVHVNEHHQIKRIRGNKVYFHEPIMHAVDPQFEWTLVTYPHIEEVGVEDLAFVANWTGRFVHHRSWLDDGGYKPLSFHNAVNSWIRRCRFTSVSEAISVSNSANVSVYDCVIDGNLGHSAIRAEGSTRSFIGAIWDKPSQWHSVGISKPAIGNVLWRIRTGANACFESHASQPRATLFDACQGAFMRGRAGGAIMNNPNHLDDLVFWNYKALDESKPNFDFWADDTPYWRFLPPTFVGFHGNETTFVPSQVKHDVSHGKPVAPESLYELQLEERLGKLPLWVVQLRDQVKQAQYTALPYQPQAYACKNEKEVLQAVSKLQPGDTLLLTGAKYHHLNLSLNQSGAFSAPIVIQSPKGRIAQISGNSAWNIDADHVVIQNIDFKETSTPDAALQVEGDYITLRNLLFDAPQEGMALKVYSSPQRASKYILIERSTFKQGKAEAPLMAVEGDMTQFTSIQDNHFVGLKQQDTPLLKIHADQTYISRNLLQDAPAIDLDADRVLLYQNTFQDVTQSIDLSKADELQLLNNFFIQVYPTQAFSGVKLSASACQLVGCNYFNLTHDLDQDNPAVIQVQMSEKEVKQPLQLIKNSVLNAPAATMEFIASSDRPFAALQIFAHHNLFANDRVQQYPLLKGDIITTWISAVDNDVQGYKLPRVAEGFAPSKTHFRYDDSKVYTENYVTPHTHYQFAPLEASPVDPTMIVNRGFRGIPLGFDQVGAKR